VTLSAGTIIEGRYEVEYPLGAGGMASVWYVRHLQLKTSHALKVLHQTAPDIRARLLEEGRIQARLKHPRIVRVTDVVALPAGIGLVMDFVSGPSLNQLLAHGPFQLSQAVAIGTGVLEGVAYAHAAGLVHRDLKPSNVLLEKGPGGFEAKVVDFGLAKALSRAAPGMTLAQSTMGTPGYMAPEQYRDAASVDARADVFSLGALLYELVCGAAPFVGGDIIDLFRQAEEEDYVAVAQHAPTLPAALIELITQSLKPDPAQRPADAGELLERWRRGAETILDAAVSSETLQTVGGPDPGSRDTLEPSDERPSGARRLAIPMMVVLGLGGLLVQLGAFTSELTEEPISEVVEDAGAVELSEPPVEAAPVEAAVIPSPAEDSPEPLAMAEAHPAELPPAEPPPLLSGQDSLAELIGRGGADFVDNQSLQIWISPHSSPLFSCVSGAWVQACPGDLQPIPLCGRWEIHVRNTSAETLDVGGAVLWNSGSPLALPETRRTLQLSPGAQGTLFDLELISTPPLGTTEHLVVVGTRPRDRLDWSELLVEGASRAGAHRAPARTWTVTHLDFKVSANLHLDSAPPRSWTGSTGASVGAVGSCGASRQAVADTTAEHLYLAPYLPVRTDAPLSRLLERAHALALTDEIGADGAAALSGLFADALLPLTEGGAASLDELADVAGPLAGRLESCLGGRAASGDLVVHGSLDTHARHASLLLDPARGIIWGGHDGAAAPGYALLATLQPSRSEVLACWRHPDFIGQGVRGGGRTLQACWDRREECCSVPESCEGW
jgi:serine/threonine protein kinase